ncbi:MAG TPA: hypothetical protein VLT88_05975, partial [Desulfosarcina sp.]|nr:hypothetical protein [Desulfosarcina sp.]
GGSGVGDRCGLDLPCADLCVMVIMKHRGSRTTMRIDWAPKGVSGYDVRATHLECHDKQLSTPL